MRVLFLHGLESSPTGAKVRRLRESGRYEVTAPELPTKPIVEYFARHGRPDSLPPELLEPSLEVATQALGTVAPHVLVGSSFGGGLAAMLAHREVWAGPLVLLAPAARTPIRLPARHGRVVVLHGRHDETVSVEGSIQLATRSVAEVMLWLVDDDHRLSTSLREGRVEAAIELAVAR